MDIDAVITWVDGSDPAYIAKRDLHVAAEERLAPEATFARRWLGFDEIKLCLASIDRYAPWFRTIWIITDEQVPDLSYLPAATAQKIRLVSHREIFRDHLDLLPTFNSVSIETMMWRIEGLADRFVYFNDDFFLINPVKPTHFFQGERTIVRGRWARMSECEAEKFFAFNLHRRHKLNAGRFYGQTERSFFSLAHVAVALRRSTIERLWEQDPSRFLANASHRFRDASQYHLPSLFCNAAIAADEAVVQGRWDWMNFSVRYCKKAGRLEPALRLLAIRSAGFKLFCVNDLATLAQRSPTLLRTLKAVAIASKRRQAAQHLSLA